MMHGPINIRLFVLSDIVLVRFESAMSVNTKTAGIFMDVTVVA